MRERVIEKYLHKQVTAAGGTTRKMKGRINDPDRLVIWPSRYRIGLGERSPTMHLIETKATKKKARAGQLREHKRLRNLDVHVEVINSVLAVDNYVAFFK